ncbi:hypothetical protein Ahu01nite_056210 [Winogradskya humida]|uniref:HTH luxR-type domain-containing protein n=2 Tax=Winogradskya humida TaxID=113566 RepID=A0ABQ3ZVA7_9ACTN|nr:hypothetical protein Ahu01nite_056210 [Actinoplanes humidus]
MQKRPRTPRALLRLAYAASGSDDGLAADLLELAGRTPPPLAAAALRHAARLTTDAAVRADALLAAARQVWLAGRPAEAGKLLRRVAHEPRLRVRVRGLAAEIAVHADGSAVDDLLSAAGQLPRESALDALLLATEVVHRAGDHERYIEVARHVLDRHAGPGSTSEDLVAGLTALYADDPRTGIAHLHSAMTRAGASDRPNEPTRTEASGRHTSMNRSGASDRHCAMTRADTSYRPDALTRADASYRPDEPTRAAACDRPDELIRAATAGVLAGAGDTAYALATRGVRLARLNGETVTVPRALEAAAFAGLASGRYPDAESAAVEGADEALRTGQPALAEVHFGILAVVAALRGDRPTTLHRVQRAGAADSSTGPGQARALCEWALGLLDLIEGRPAATVARLTRILVTPSGRGNAVLQVAATPHLIEALAAAQMALGEPAATPGRRTRAAAQGRRNPAAARALDALVAGRAFDAPVAGQAFNAPVAGQAADALVAGQAFNASVAGQAVDALVAGRAFDALVAGQAFDAPIAERAFDQFERWASATGRAPWLALRARSRALLASGPDDAVDLFREALREHDRGDTDFARAHTQLLYGRHLRRHRQPGAAREHLHAAAATFTALGAGPWAAEAMQHLRAAGAPAVTYQPRAAGNPAVTYQPQGAGGPAVTYQPEGAGGPGVTYQPRAGEAPAPPEQPGTTGLTAQQDRIARMVAAGATNREIAQQLYLSPRTVDHHLRNVYARLGVRSRTELARRIPPG